MEATTDQLVGWVGRHMLPHEASLRVWLKSAFPGIDTDDVIQEAYCRLSALDQVGHILDPRQYFFRTAKNVVVEQIRRTRVISIEAASGLVELEGAIAEESFSPERVLAGKRSLQRVEQLIAALPERGRRIFRLRKIEGYSQREIAAIMGVSEEIVENEVTRGLRRILQSMTEEERTEMRVRPRRGGKDGKRDRSAD
ncbi:MAG: sigma-70 family RNA polymerase sigma factor [Sphingomonas sp.]